MEKIFTRGFTLCFFAHFAFTCCYYLLIPTLPIYLSKLGSTEFEIGILIGISSLASMALRPLVGKALIKISEKKFMIVGTIIFLFAAISYLLILPFWPILIARIFQGIGWAFFSTASITLIGNIIPKAHRGQSFSYFYLSYNIAFAIAPFFGMLLINHFSFKLLFLVCSALSLCSLIITSGIGNRQLESLDNLSFTDRSLLNLKALPASVVAFFVYLIWGALTAFFPLYAIHHGMTNPGLFFSTFAIMLILGRGLGGKIFDLCSIKNVIMFCLIIYVIAMSILVFAKTSLMFILVALIWGIGNAFLLPSLLAYITDLAGFSGPAIGTFMAFSDLGVCLGPVIMGLVLRFSNYQVMFLCLALVGVLNFSYFFFFMRKKVDLVYRSENIRA